MDVSVIGIDDIFFAFRARPPLTTISVPREQLGVMTFEALEKMLKFKRQGIELYIGGESCRPQFDRAGPEVNSEIGSQIESLAPIELRS